MNVGPQLTSGGDGEAVGDIPRKKIKEAYNPVGFTDLSVNM